jgi:nucleoside-diphosphate-sugar epimerase
MEEQRRLLKHMVTGSEGFIGKYLQAAITGAGDTIQRVDPKMGLSCSDIKAKVSMGGVEMVWHLAAIEGATKQQPLSKIIEKEVANVEHVMRGAFNAHAKLVVFSSTEVYLPVPVEFHDFNSRTAYAAAKRAVEAAVLATGYPEVAVLRLGGVAGRRQDHRGGSVMARFAEQSKLGESLTVFNQGKATRSFIHVLDVVSACTALIENWEPGVYDIVNPDNTISIKELAQTISTQSNISTKQTRPQDIGLESYYEVGDPSTNLKGPKGWKPKHPLKDVIRDALTY